LTYGLVAEVHEKHTNGGTWGGMLTRAGKRTKQPATAPPGRECAEWSTVLSIYNRTDRCSLHRSARDADKRLLQNCDGVLLGMSRTELQDDDED
jgi:hypothetical protein